MSLRTRLNIHHPLLTGPGNNLWKSARIFCKIAIKGCRNLQTLHSIPSSYFSILFPFPAFSSFASILFDWPRVFFEKRYHDIPAVSILHLPTSLVFSPFLSQNFHPSHRRPSFPSQHSFSPFCPSFFLLSLSSSNTLHFSLPRFTLPPQCSRFERFLQSSISRISDHFYSLTHIPVSLTGVLLLGRQIYRRVYWGCTRVKCHRSKFLVCWRAKVSREYRIRDEDQPSWFIFRVGVIRRPPPVIPCDLSAIKGSLPPFVSQDFNFFSFLFLGDLDVAGPS